MLFHSIRWRLQLWHGLLLVVVLAGFGFTAHRLDRESRLRRVDQELQDRVSALGAALQRRGSERPPPPGRPPPATRGRSGVISDDESPPPSRGTERMPPPPRDFRLSARGAALFEESDPLDFYFVLWVRDGRVLSRSSNAPPNVPRPEPGSENGVRMHGSRRELAHTTPPGESFVVGRDIRPELAEMRRLAWLLAGAGGGVLMAGLAGGWWLSSRAIRPLHDISATAAGISTGDLSQRIRTADTDSELGQLAGVLNSTFARLESSFAQQGRFTADAAHELRTPVTVILAQAQAALSRERAAGEYRESLEACERAALRMKRLIESLLELARLDGGQEPMARDVCDLARITTECVQQLRTLIAERRLFVDTDLASAECLGDPNRLAQVVTNLIANAVHYNKEAGDIRVVTKREGNEAVLRVTDSGLGIAAEDLPHLFERFYRADKSRSRAQGRAGLGLAIGKAIVDAHVGHIEVASTPGVGSTFTVRLPAGDPAVKPEPDSSNAKS